MIDLSKVKDKSLLEDAARNMGWEEDESIEPFLEALSKRDPEQIMRRWAAWHLGDSSWATMIIDGFKELKAAEK